MEKKNIVLLDIDYVTDNDKAVVRLFGKETVDNKTNHIIAIDRTFEPYLYAVPKNMEKAKQQLKEIDVVKRLETKTLRYLGQETEVIKIIVGHPQNVSSIRDTIRKLPAINTIYEHDIPFYRRYLINNNIFPMSEIEIQGEIVETSTCLPNNPENVIIMELNSAPLPGDSKFPKLNMLSFDIEVRSPKGMPNPDINEIIMIGIAGNCGVEKVISTKGEDVPYAEKVNTEAEIIKRFVETINQVQPDVIVGYNSDNFDFDYIRKRAKILGVKLNIGSDGSTLKFIRRGYTNAATIKGIIHVDLYLVMRRYMNLDRYTLERVYLELFGEEKFDLPGEKLWQYWDADGQPLKDLFKYSLSDVVTTYQIAEKILPLSLELTRIVGQPLFDIARLSTGQQIEWFLTRKAYEKDELVPNKPSGAQYAERKGERTLGGYVKEPDKGLHENIVQFDFRSLYPSIIISKNISPDTFAGNITIETNDDNENDTFNIEDIKYNISPEYGYKFIKEPKGFIPSVLGQVLNERVRVKQMMLKTEDPMEKKVLDVQQQALKRLANTMYGVYGYSRFRWYSIECARSITAWGRDYIKKTMKQAEAYGFKSIYADTDGFYAEYEPKK